jgi:IS30 family transposase
MVRMSDSEQGELWDRWEAGESQRSIARALGRPPETVRARLLSSGWRRPIPGVEWCRLRLSMGEREEISRGIARCESLRSIASRLDRSPSTVSREVRINGGYDRYRATVAHRASRGRAKRPKAMKLETCPRLRQVVEDKLELWWSPAQISLWLETEYCDEL